jgi:hypothetical protein
MSPWSRRDFEELERRVMATLDGTRPTLDVPYYIFCYPPEEETLALREFSNLEKRLRRKGHSVESLWMSHLMTRILDHYGFLGKESSSPEAEDSVGTMSDLKRLLPDEISEVLVKQLGGHDESHCTLLLRWGALRPFVHVSTVLASLEGKVHCVLVVAYPGRREGYMLNEKTEEVRSYYRAEIIGCE